jgi:hypothetical protein
MPPTTTYFKIVSHRELFNKHFRDALPDVAGQGYFKRLDRAYQIGQPFFGKLQPIKFRKSPSATVEEHLIDFVYRPIEDERGRVVGIFVEGCDRTQRAAA